jgi:hypothetical protein
MFRKVTTLLRASQLGRTHERLTLLNPIRDKVTAASTMPPICSVEFPEAKESPLTGVDSVKWAKCIIQGRSKVVSGDKETTLCSSFLPDLTVVIKDGDA